MSVYNINGTNLDALYNKDGVGLQRAYAIGGNQIFPDTHTQVDYDTSTKSIYLTAPTFSKYMQAFDIRNGYIFQFLANANENPDLMAVVDVAQGVNLGNVTCKAGHANCASFSDEKYDSNDAFPLLYVSSFDERIYVNRILSTSATQLIRTLFLPIANAGYHTNFVVDGHFGYAVGYKNDDTVSDSGGNKIIISKWDLSQLYDNGNGTFTPHFVSSFERPFIYVVQGCQFHDGMIWVASGGTNVRGYVYALNPIDGSVLHTYDTELTTEVEGIAWISDNQMVVGYQRLKYELVTFDYLEEVTT